VVVVVVCVYVCFTVEAGDSTETSGGGRGAAIHQHRGHTMGGGGRELLKGGRVVSGEEGRERERERGRLMKNLQRAFCIEYTAGMK
jgi:hypothetical protein